MYLFFLSRRNLGWRRLALWEMSSGEVCARGVFNVSALAPVYYGRLQGGIHTVRWRCAWQIVWVDAAENLRRARGRCHRAAVADGRHVQKSFLDFVLSSESQLDIWFDLIWVDSLCNCGGAWHIVSFSYDSYLTRILYVSYTYLYVSYTYLIRIESSIHSYYVLWKCVTNRIVSHTIRTSYISHTYLIEHSLLWRVTNRIVSHTIRISYVCHTYRIEHSFIVCNVEI